MALDDQNGVISTQSLDSSLFMIIYPCAARTTAVPILQMVETET